MTILSNMETAPCTHCMGCLWLDGPQNWSVRYRENNLLTLPRIKPCFPGWPASSLVVVPLELFYFMLRFSRWWVHVYRRFGEMCWLQLQSRNLSGARLAYYRSSHVLKDVKKWNLQFKKKRRLSWIAEQLLASQEGFCFMELVPVKVKFISWRN